MAEKKKAKDTVENESLDCPQGHKKSMSYVTRNRDDKQAMALFRITRRMGSNVKTAICSECGLMLNFVDLKSIEN
jgi:hypothetical protein